MKTLYVTNADEDFIYKIDSANLELGYDGKDGYITYTLDLLCGKDYVSDEYDYIGWCSPDHFDDNHRYDTVVQYFEEETLKDVLEENGYFITSDIPDHIYQWGEEPSEIDLMW